MNICRIYSLCSLRGLGPGKNRCTPCLQSTQQLDPMPCVLSLPAPPHSWIGCTPRPSPSLTTTLPRKTPSENPRNLNPALLSPASFFEHTRLEGPTANTCLVCNVSFQTNAGLEGHAKDSHHSAYLCACDTAFSRLYTLERHINSKTGSGYHCELCGDRTLPRIDKLYDHLRDGHKVSQTVLDQHREKALGRARKLSRSIKPAPAPTPVPTTQFAPSGGFGSSWSSAGQMNGMASRHTMNMAPSSLNGINPAQLTVSFLERQCRINTGSSPTSSWLT